MSDSLKSHGLWPARLLCHWDSPGKNTELLPCPPFPGDLPHPGIEPMFLPFPALADRFFTTNTTWFYVIWAVTNEWTKGKTVPFMYI